MRFTSLRYPFASGRRQGVTLVELLVVLGIVLLISTVALTMMTPGLPQRQLRETSRELVTLLQGARDRAMRLKRNVGVQIERLRGAGDAAVASARPRVMVSVGYRASLIEQPPPYCGDSTGSRISIEFVYSSPTQPSYSSDGHLLARVVGIGTTLGPDSGWQGLLRPGSLIRVGTQGHLFEIDEGITAVDPEGYVNALPTSAAPWPVHCLTYTNPLPSGVTLTEPYQVIQPMVGMSAGAIEFPPQAAIDLNASGMANAAGDEFSGRKPGDGNVGRDLTDLPVQIIFGPDGGIASVRVGGWEVATSAPKSTATGFESFPLTSRSTDSLIEASTALPVCLMIGKISQIGLPDYNETQIHTWQDPESIWVTIHPTTGRIRSTENYTPLTRLSSGNPEATDGDVDDAAEKQHQLGQARTYALDAQSLGGR